MEQVSRFEFDPSVAYAKGRDRRSDTLRIGNGSLTSGGENFCAPFAKGKKRAPLRRKRLACLLTTGKRGETFRSVQVEEKREEREDERLIEKRS